MEHLWTDELLQMKFEACFRVKPETLPGRSDASSACPHVRSRLCSSEQQHAGGRV